MATPDKQASTATSGLFAILPFLLFAAESVCASICFFTCRDSVPVVKSIFAKLLSFNFILAGLAHFSPRMYHRLLSMIFLPFKDFWLYSSGMLLILGGLGVLFQRSQKEAAWLLVATLIAVFPSNLACVVMEHPRRLVCGGSVTNALLRLPFQFTFIIWAYWYTF